MLDFNGEPDPPPAHELITHLLKCQFQADHQTHSWEHALDEQVLEDDCLP